MFWKSCLLLVSQQYERRVGVNIPLLLWCVLQSLIVCTRCPYYFETKILLIMSAVLGKIVPGFLFPYYLLCVVMYLVIYLFVCLFLALKARKHSHSQVWFGERHERGTTNKNKLCFSRKDKNNNKCIKKSQSVLSYPNFWWSAAPRGLTWGET
jgi:hypothetical protein